MIKKIIKIFLVILLIEVLVFLYFRDNQQLNYIDYLHTQINKLSQSNNQLLNNDITLEGNLQDYERKLIQSLNDIKEPDTNTLLNGSVFIQDMLGMGSGTVIKKTENSMYILTCAHVVSDVYNFNQNGFPLRGTLGYLRSGKFGQVSGMVIYPYTIIKYDTENDLALIKADYADEFLNVIPLADIAPQIGDTVYSVGNPIGFIRTFSKGVLANKTDGFYIFDGITTFGNSGGGLFNREGELVGVPAQVPVYAVLEGAAIPESSLGMSITLERIKTFLEGVEY